MPNRTLGITATELFACNPYRILGIPVNAEESEVNSAYQKLLNMVGTPEYDSYSTAFDFPELPPFTRDTATLRNAYAKLSSIGYRCFAFSDGIFSQPLNVDDVMLNLEDITSYDCFLRCYMWLITNDRDFEEPELWIPLCRYIDKLIASGPDKWAEYYDNRFPESVLKGGVQALHTFHTTFKDIILLPIKELVRGSMRCKNAIDILVAAKVDINEVFPEIDIPQANLPKPGEPAPKLKIAVKDGEEYFDVSLGKMVNFESDTEAAVESNSFTSASTRISAEALDEEPEQTAPPKQEYSRPAPQTEHKVSLTDSVPAENKSESSNRVFLVEPDSKTASQPAKPAAEEQPVKHVEAIESFAKPRVRPKPSVSSAAEESKGISNISLTENSAPTGSDRVADISFPQESKSDGLKVFATVERDESGKPKAAEEPKAAFYKPPTESKASNEPYDPFALTGGSKPTGRAAAVVTSEDGVSSGRRKKVSLTGLDGLSDSGASDVNIQLTPPKGQRSAAAVVQEEKPASKISERRTLNDIIEAVENKTEETANELLTKQEEEDELYTDVLIKMLRSHRSNKLMKDVDTKHVFDNGDALGSGASSTLTMDEINLKKTDPALLDAAYDGSRAVDETNPKEAIRNKYKNINISDMLNPTLGGKLNREYTPDAIEEYKKEKQQDKAMSKMLLKLFGFVLFVGALVAFLIIMTNG